MKYYETSKFPKAVSNFGFYSIIAICLVAVGAITWFAVSRYNKVRSMPENTPSYQSEPPVVTPVEDEPADPEPEPEVPARPTEEPVEDVPYEPEVPKTAFTLPQGKIIKDYSDSALQYSATYGDMRLHNGVDIAAETGSEFKTSASGTVTAINEDSVLGKCVTVEHADGITVKYCGFENVGVSEGENISAGRVIGTVGTVPGECADESHIHLVIKKDGKIISPSGN